VDKDTVYIVEKWAKEEMGRIVSLLVGRVVSIYLSMAYICVCNQGSIIPLSIIPVSKKVILFT